MALKNKNTNCKDENSHLFDTPEFTKEMKQTHTILSPDIFPLHMKLIQNVFVMYGLKISFNSLRN